MLQQLEGLQYASALA